MGLGDPVLKHNRARTGNRRRARDVRARRARTSAQNVAPKRPHRSGAARSGRRGALAGHVRGLAHAPRLGELRQPRGAHVASAAPAAMRRSAIGAQFRGRGDSTGAIPPDPIPPIWLQPGAGFATAGGAGASTGFPSIGA
jgi:hypothetical protein